MKTFAAVILSVMLVFLGRAQAQGPQYGGSGGPDVTGGSLLINPTCTVNSLGGGNYQYTISFQNTDNTPIWDFLVWTPGSANLVSSPFSGFSALGYSSCLPEYNYNNSYNCLSFYDGTSFPCGSGVGIGVGNTCTISFDLNQYCTSFVCGYEIDNYYCGEGQGCKGIGVCSVPEVSSTLILAGLAALSMVGFKKMVRS